MGALVANKPISLFEGVLAWENYTKGICISFKHPPILGLPETHDLHSNTGWNLSIAKMRKCFGGDSCFGWTDFPLWLCGKQLLIPPRLLSIV